MRRSILPPNLTINVRTLAQRILFETELKGQLSDGHWENTTPHYHWEMPAAAKIVVNPSNVGTSFSPIRPYGFASKSLIEAVGLRMVNAVKFYSTFPHLLDVNHSHWDFEFEGSVDDYVNHVKSLAGLVQYDCDKYRRIMMTMGVSTVEELAQKLAPVKDVNFTLTMLRKELRDLSEIYKTRAL